MIESLKNYVPVKVGENIPAGSILNSKANPNPFGDMSGWIPVSEGKSIDPQCVRIGTVFTESQNNRMFIMRPKTSTDGQKFKMGQRVTWGKNKGTIISAPITVSDRPGMIQYIVRFDCATFSAGHNHPSDAGELTSLNLNEMKLKQTISEEDIKGGARFANPSTKKFATAIRMSTGDFLFGGKNNVEYEIYDLPPMSAKTSADYLTAEGFEPA